MRIVMCDLDGCLCDTRHRDDLLFSKKIDEYNAQCGGDTAVPEVVRLINGYKERGYFICLISGRSEAMLDVTLEWLYENDVSFDRVVLRDEADLSLNHVLKTSAINQIITEIDGQLAVVIEGFERTANFLIDHPHRPLVLQVKKP